MLILIAVGVDMKYHRPQSYDKLANMYCHKLKIQKSTVLHWYLKSLWYYLSLPWEDFILQTYMILSTCYAALFGVKIIQHDYL